MWRSGRNTTGLWSDVSYGEGVTTTDTAEAKADIVIQWDTNGAAGGMERHIYFHGKQLPVEICTLFDGRSFTE